MNKQTTFFTGPPSPTHVRHSFRRVRGLAASGIALCAVFFFLYAFKVYTTLDVDTDTYKSLEYPSKPFHSGLSDPPPGFYADQLANPFAGTNDVEDKVHHQLSEDGSLTESDRQQNSNDPTDPVAADEEKSNQEDTPAVEETQEKPAETETTASAPTSASIPSEYINNATSPANNPVNITEAPSQPIISIANETLVLAANPNKLTTAVVVGRTDAGINGTAWIFEKLQDVTNAAIYIVDDPTAPLHLDRNKGREAMVYIKYIIEHYDTLEDVTVFFHSGQEAWHNNILFNKDGAAMINNLRRQHVQDVGYFNLRCELHPGCPRWVLWNATREENLHRHPERFNDLFSAKLWDILFPERTHDPEYLAEACCSQFAISREMIQSRPLSQYQRIHDYLSTSRIDDGYLGRVFEYVWQFLWLDIAEHCPSMTACYCDGYGVCLEGEDATALVEWNTAKSDEDEILAELGAYDSANCNDIKDDMDRRECKKANPVLPKLRETRKKANSLMESNLKPYIVGHR